MTAGVIRCRPGSGRSQTTVGPDRNRWFFDSAHKGWPPRIAPAAGFHQFLAMDLSLLLRKYGPDLLRQSRGCNHRLSLAESGPGIGRLTLSA